jgi:hypothetical protein
MAIEAGKLMNVSSGKKAQTQPKASLVPTKGGQYSIPKPDGSGGGPEGGGKHKNGILSDLQIIQEKTITIEEHLKETYNLQKTDVRNQRYADKVGKRVKAENLLERKNEDKKKIGSMNPLQKETKAVENFFLSTLLGFIMVRLIPFVGPLAKFLKIAAKVFDWIIDIAGHLFNAVAGFIEFGFKVVDGVKGIVSKIFGPRGAKAFDKFTGIFTKIMNLAMILMMATTKMGKPNKMPKSAKKSPKWKKNLNKKFKKTKIGKATRNLKARKLKMVRKLKNSKIGRFAKGLKKFSPKNLLKRGGKWIMKGGPDKLLKGAGKMLGKGAGVAKGVAGKAAGKIGGFAAKIFGKAAKFIAPAMKSAKPFVSKFFGKIPIIGPLVVGIVSVVSGEPLGKALFKTLGAALGGALGTFIPIPVLGTLIGETIGVFVGDLLYEGLMGKGWGAAGKKLLSSLMKIFQAGAAVAKWIGSGFKRFWKKIPKIKIPDIPKNPPKWIPNWVPFKNKVWNVFKTGVKVMIGPLSLLMGQEIPNLLWLLNPLKTIPAAVQSFFPPKGEGGGDADKIKTKEMEDADDKKKKKKKKVNPLAKKVKKLEKELKIAKKKKMLIFKVNRVDAGGDIAEQTSYEQTGTTVITQPIIEETIVNRNTGGGGSTMVVNVGESTNMEAALS